jgi:hypothetical protein
MHTLRKAVQLLPLAWDEVGPDEDIVAGDIWIWMGSRRLNGIRHAAEMAAGVPRADARCI